MEPCPCDFCEAERWCRRMLADESLPSIVRVGLLGLVLSLEQRRADVNAIVAERSRSRARRALDAVRGLWRRLGEQVADATDYMSGEPAVAVAAALWAAMWFWGSVVWACVGGSWSLRGLAVAAGAGWMLGNRAALRRMRGEE
jgi:hypothetical protein